ncbi:type I DNA topoisomerase [Alcanivorax sp. 1008]|uniref:type I DNA topoisomerase n=1 Tax=Alcanivorax sp. 1008 TaxID=2816853 RepID=UPI001D229873|nr:type I DNA topoisomerase [Alcanivorax sp. 1008]MCC1496832.1 type I DNA topoisomerase [Alcanivorax sp. 1008]
MKLLIVESPNKAKHIAHFIGPDWKVMASFGHIRDLPRKELGVDLGNLRPRYEIIDRARDAVRKLQAAAKGASEVYLATDPDREGEAIAWHLASALKIQRPRRVTYNEVTEKAVKAALADPREIDMDMVRAQETRRILDRLVGYLVSPVMSQVTGAFGLSAGRVQSVAVRLVAQRERDINSFVSEAYYIVRATFVTSVQGKDYTWHADWDPSSLLQPGTKHWTDRAVAAQVATCRKFQIRGIDKGESLRHPPKPFTTSTLQQAASASLQLSPKDTMQLAQNLFERGLITYHRTDSPTLSDEAMEGARAWLRGNGMEMYLPAKPVLYKAKGNAQEAHEAIRPADISRREAGTGDARADALYEMIWSRTVASQMLPARFDTVKVNMVANQTMRGAPIPFVAKGRTMTFPGWTALTADDAADAAEDKEEEKDQLIPPLEDRSIHQSAATQVIDKKTKPPSRYTEASLIKELERHGIGRPATYAAIMENIKGRNYISVKKRKVHCEPLGSAIVDLLAGTFRFMEVPFTAQMEERLDAIAGGKDTYQATVGSLLQGLNLEIEALRAKRVNARDFGVVETKESCPKCQSKIVRRQSKKNKRYFWSCMNEKCNTIYADEDGSPLLAQYSQPPQKCPSCQKGTLNLYPGRNGGPRAWICSEKLTCGAKFDDAGGKPNEKSEKKTIITEHQCPSCKKGMLVQRSGANGKFFSCNGYPKCKTTMNELDGQPDLAAWAREQQLPACPKCKKGKMRERKGVKGTFYGCSNYPKCKHTVEDLKELVMQDVIRDA